MSQQSQRRGWSYFVLGVGLVLTLLNAGDTSPVALTLGVVMVFAGLLGVLLGS